MPTHKKPESERFKGPVKYVEYLVARGLFNVLQRLPIRVAYRIGRGVGWLACKTMSKRRAIVRKNLEIVNAWLRAQGADDGAMMANGGEFERRKKNPHHSSAITHSSSLALPLEAQVREVFQRAGANLFSGFTFNRMSVNQLEKHIQIEGIEDLKAALAEGKGAIILLAHMGPWEALTQLPGLAKQYGIEAAFAAMYRPLNNTYLDDWYKSQREARGTRLFSRRDGFHKPVDFLRAGGILGILADQKMREGVDAPYFGRMCKTTPIPGLFHRRSGAPIMGASVSTVGHCRWRVHFRRIPLPDHSEKADRQALAVVANEALMEMLSDSPCDGFWFQNRF